MSKRRARKSVAEWDGAPIEPGERADVALAVSESYAGVNISIPAHVWRAPEPGPTVFVTGAVHGDEINGTGTIRHILLQRPFELLRGALLLVPVVNIQGFERHSRYLPDRRDLNRCFPGSAEGSLAARLANAVFEEIVARSDYGLDLHSASVRRTNFPNVRADMNDEPTRWLAGSFGAGLIIDAPGPKGSLRREAVRRGCPTILLEAGEVWKVEPGVVEYSLRGISNVLASLGMIDAEVVPPPYRIVLERTRWLRATSGGFLQFHVAPGALVHAGDPIATHTGLLGQEGHVMVAPRDAIVLGMTTLPSVSPGDPVCHLAYPEKGALERLLRALAELPGDALHHRLREDLATNVLVAEPDPDAT